MILYLQQSIKLLCTFLQKVHSVLSLSANKKLRQSGAFWSIFFRLKSLRRFEVPLHNPS